VIARCYLTYDPRFAKPNVFYWVAELETIRARIQLASAPEVSPVDIHLRFRGKTKAQGLVHCHPIDDCTFMLEDALVHQDLPRIQIALVSVPEDVARELMAL
jgi:hypothetical protein